MIKVSDLKKDFPIFDREINGKRLTYLDSGATSQKPNSVINEMTNVYTNMNANVHRGTYVLSSETTAKYEEVRNKLKNFINAYSSDEIIFTKGCTEGFNFLANSICKDLNSGDEIILSVHVFVDGVIVESGGVELSEKLEKEGYESYL